MEQCDITKNEFFGKYDQSKLKYCFFSFLGYGFINSGTTDRCCKAHYRGLRIENANIYMTVHTVETCVRKALRAKDILKV